MSTLIVEGGHRLGGSVSVRGQQERRVAPPGGLSPDGRAVHVVERAAHRRRPRNGRVAQGTRRRGRGHRHDDDAGPVRDDPHGRAGCAARRTVARLRAADRSAAGAAGTRDAGPAGRRFPRPPHAVRPPAGVARHGGAGRGGRAAHLQRAGRADPGLVLPGGSVCHGHGDRHSGRGRCARRHRDPTRRL